MDQIAHTVRLEQWKAIINECLASGMKKTTWCRENGISEKQFFYWQRKLREEAYQELQPPAVLDEKCPVVEAKPSFVELPAITEEAVSHDFCPDIVIRSGKNVIEISNTASDTLIALIGGLLHAK